jgi:DNA repair exonuclease SbcCD ATPase subunit
MSQDESGSESGVSTESTASSETAPLAQSQEAASSNEAASAPQKEAPFHEHPRFQELVQQKNQSQQEFHKIQQAYQQLQSQFSQIQQQFNKSNQPQKPSYDPLFEELKAINPAFAKFQEETYGKVQTIDEMKQELQDLRETYQADRTARDAQAAQSDFKRLCSDNKVSDTDAKMYQHYVANLANARGSKVSDLPALFKEVHDELGKFFSERDRSTRESYTKQKAADKVPASQTGGVAASNSKGDVPSSIQDVKSRIAAAMRAAKNT